MTPPPVACGREMELLLACSRTAIGEATAARVRDLAQQSIDWEALLAAAEAHDTRPLLARTLATVCPNAAPAAVAAALRAWVHANSLRSVRLTAELARLLRALHRAGVAALPIKGPLLADMAYGDLALRYSVDLDLLFRPRDLARSIEVLAALGYSLSPECSRHEQAYRHVHNHLTLLNGAQTMVEAHWRLAPRHFSVHIAFDDLWQRRRPVALGGASLDAPCAEDMLLLVCVHGALHGWKQLKNVCDVSELIQRQPIAWPAVWRRAQQSGVQRMLLLGLMLCRELLQTPLPPDASDRIAGDAALPELRDETLPALRSQRPARGEAGWRSFPAYYARLRERRRDRIEETLRRLFIPTMPEWESAGLTRSLPFLNYVVRPLRLVGRSLSLRRRPPS